LPNLLSGAQRVIGGERWSGVYQNSYRGRCSCLADRGRKKGSHLTQP